MLVAQARGQMLTATAFDCETYRYPLQVLGVKPKLQELNLNTGAYVHIHDVPYKPKKAVNAVGMLEVDDRFYLVPPLPAPPAQNQR